MEKVLLLNLALVTRHGIYKPASKPEHATDQINAWLECPDLVVGSEESGYWQVLENLIIKANIMGGAIHDARIVAICLQHGVTELYSADRDFMRFPTLTVTSPIFGNY